MPPERTQASAIRLRAMRSPCKGTEPDDQPACVVIPSALLRHGGDRRGATLAAWARLRLSQTVRDRRPRTDLSGRLAEAVADAPDRSRPQHQDRRSAGAPAG